MENLTFSQMPLSKEIQSAVADMGFTTPSPIQAQAIPYLLLGRDMIGQAQTGTGKTAAFGIPALESIDELNRNIQVLVLCPTRELAVQVAQEFKKLAKYKDKTNVAAIYGGEFIDKQINQLKRGVQIVVGTPGRVIDHIERGTLRLQDVKMMILDEADEMLNMGFKEDIELILKEVPASRQTVFFSATMPAPIMELTKKYQQNPQLVKVVNKELTNTRIEQFYFSIKPDQKMELMTRLIEFHQLKNMLVFCNTKQKTDEVAEELESRGYPAEAIHGDLSQNQRNNVMGKFRNGKVGILVATDVAARGIDVDDLEAVFNFDTPLDPEYYVHRIGRTGRAGKTGMAFTFVTGRDNGKMRDIEYYAKVKIAKGIIPTQEDILLSRKNKFAEKVKEEIAKGDLHLFDDLLESLMSEGLELPEITAALLKLQFGDKINEENNEHIDFMDASYERKDKFSKGKNDRNDRFERGGRRDSGSNGSRKSGSQTSTVRLFVNLGKEQRISKGDLLGAIAGETGMKGNQIGAIDIYDKYSFVDVPKSDVDKIMRVMNSTKIKGKKANFEIAR